MGEGPDVARGRRRALDVSDTAFVTAGIRARETQRARPLFRDPLAGVVAGERGLAIAASLHSRVFFHGVTARTAVFDELILQVVNRDGAECVVNLGAGLDTRPYRLAVPADLRWVEADLPRIIEYKGKVLDGEQPRCQLERFSVDVSDAAARREFLDRVSAGRRTLLLSEGLLTYLPAPDVAELARDAATPAAVEWWLLDFVGTPKLLSWANRFLRRRHTTEARLRFASPDGPEIFRPWGWDPVEVRSSWLEQRRLGREPWPMHAAWVVSPPRLRQRLATTTLFALLKRQRR